MPVTTCHGELPRDCYAVRRDHSAALTQGPPKVVLYGELCEDNARGAVRRREKWCGEGNSGCGEEKKWCGEEKKWCGEEKVYFGATVEGLLLHLRGEQHPGANEMHCLPREIWWAHNAEGIGTSVRGYDKCSALYTWLQ